MSKEYEETFKKITEKIGKNYKSYILLCDDKENKTICMGGAGSTFDNLKYFLAIATHILTQTKKDGEKFLKNTEDLLTFLLAIAKHNAENDIDNPEIGLSIISTIAKIAIMEEISNHFDDDDEDDDEDDDD